VDDERSLRITLNELMEEQGYDVSVAESGEECLKMIREQDFDAVLLDVKLPGRDGIDILGEIRRVCPDTEVVMMTAYGTFDSAVKAAKLGCFRYIAKPFEAEHMKLVVSEALRNAKLRKRLDGYLAAQRRRLLMDAETVFGTSPAIQGAIEKARKVSGSNTATVVIEGETGVGKELVARLIHFSSPRSGGPFIELNCSALPEHLLESELFGHEKGAFTDAKSTKRGLFELADSGSLFLDEIGEMSVALQAKLLRVIESKRFRRIGGTVEIDVNTRIIAATNKNLKERVREGKFREDLYYRLSVVPIRVPSLRERKQDIPMLATAFLHQLNKDLGKKVAGFSDEAMELLRNYSWPGNVRELKNVIERVVILESADEIRPEHLPAEIVENAGFLQSQDFLGQISSSQTGVPTLEEVEQVAIQHALKKADGNKTKAAQWLGISRQTLRAKLKEYKLENARVGK